MSSTKVNCGNIEISNDNKICIIAGPCQLETEQHALDMAGKILEITKKFGLGFIYKTSFDKANSCLLYTSPSPRDISGSRMPSSA